MDLKLKRMQSDGGGRRKGKANGKVTARTVQTVLDEGRGEEKNKMRED